MGILETDAPSRQSPYLYAPKVLSLIFMSTKCSPRNWHFQEKVILLSIGKSAVVDIWRKRDPQKAKTRFLQLEKDETYNDSA